MIPPKKQNTYENTHRRFAYSGKEKIHAGGRYLSRVTMKIFRNITKIRLLVALTLTVVFAFFGCTATQPALKDDRVYVTLVKSEYYDIAEGSSVSACIESGQNATFFIMVKNGFYLADTDYEGAEIENGENGITKIHLPSIEYNLRVTLLFKEKTPTFIETPEEELGADPKDDPYNDVENLKAIRYYANGGQYYHSNTSYEVEIQLNGHLRPNTEIGTDKIYRKGYNLLCWNTQADGSGISYGLGSRCDLPKEKQLRLYAQWAKWSPLADFTFSQTDGEYCITAYNGTNNNICIPETIEGIPVTSIAKGAFSKRQFQSVILPKSMERVEDEAFHESTVRELWFYDNLTYISDSAFLNAPKMPTVHINAILAPRYSAYDRHSNYADKVDILISHAREKKIVLFGGSGTFFSVDSSMMYEAFEEEYQVINMGINGWFPATAQTDIILHYLQEGDVFLHLPEMISMSQLFYKNSFALLDDFGNYDDRYMMCLESNYDLLALINLDDTPGAFDSFTRYNTLRKNKKAVNYSDYADYIDEFGDYKHEKRAYGSDSGISYNADFNTEYLTDAALARLDLLYQNILDKGARPYLGYAAVNISYLSEQDKWFEGNYLTEKAPLFDALLREKIKNAPIIESITDAFYPGGLFYDSDWHLSDEGTAMNTEVLIARLKSYM